MSDLTSQIPIPGSRLVNPETGLVIKAWYDFFTALFLRTGGATFDVNLLLDTLGDVRGGMLARFNLSWSEFVASVPNSIPIMSPGADVELRSILELLDLIGSTQGEILFRGAAGWELLEPGTAGYLLQTNGAGADPSWVELFDAWTAYTPVITANTGAFTTVSATGKYKQIGKTVFVQMQINITTNGTAAGYVIATLPINQNGTFTYHGRANNVSGKMLQGLTFAANNIIIYNYDNTYPGANGEALILNGTYESV